MSESKHTEGPWQSQHDFDRDGELTIIGAIDGPDGGHNDFHFKTVCIVEEGEEASANAHLIAAAPELVLALAEIAAKATLAADMCDDEGRASGFRILAADARAAILKATGGEA